jgi:beta-galactosidase
VQARDAEIMRRELNCNMVRCAHYPQAEGFYDACDELGLLAWGEAPGWGYLGDEAWKALAYRDIGEMIARDRNHPSIIIWGAPIPRPFSRGRRRRTGGCTTSPPPTTGTAGCSPGPDSTTRPAAATSTGA